MIPPFANPFFSIRCLVSCYPYAYLSHKSYCQPRHLFSPCRLFLYEFIILDLTSSVNQKFRPDDTGRKNLYSICYPNPSVFPVLHSIQILTGFQLLFSGILHSALSVFSYLKLSVGIKHAGYTLPCRFGKRVFQYPFHISFSLIFTQNYHHQHRYIILFLFVDFGIKLLA